MSRAMEYSEPLSRRIDTLRRSGGLVRVNLIATLCLGLLALAPPSQAAKAPGFPALYDLVPARADGFVAVDHQRLKAHKAATKVRQFVHDQGGARGLQALISLGLEPAKDIVRSLSFNIGFDEADLVSGRLDVQAIKAQAKGRLAGAYEEGEQGGRGWFSVAKGRRFVSLGQGLAVVGGIKMIRRVLARAEGKGKSLKTRTAFKAMNAPAKKAKAALWGAGWASKSMQRRVTGPEAKTLKSISRTRFHVAGKGDVTVVATAFTGSKKDAQALKVLIETELDRTFKTSLTFKMLGVSALVSSITFAAKGKSLVATLPLNPAQVDLIATTGGKVLSILRAKRSR